MLSKIVKRSSCMFFVIAMVISLISVSAAAQSVAEGLVTVGDSSNTATLSGDTVTMTVTGSYILSKSNTITIENVSDSVIEFVFKYEISNQSSNPFPATEGEITLEMEPGATQTYTFEAAKKTTATVTITAVSWEVLISSVDLTVNFDSSLGGVTVGGNSVTSGVATAVDYKTDVAVKATATSGKFAGWYDANGNLLSLAATYTTSYSEATTISAKFSSGLLFLVGTQFYSNLNDANTYATSSGIGTIILVGSGTLTSGTYTITNGNTLLIPYNGAATLATSEPPISSSYSKPSSAFRTLTMNKNAKIIIEDGGAMSVASALSAKMGSNGMPTSAHGRVKMKTGSSIVVKDGGTLYAWGFITNYSTTSETSYSAGSITVESGGTVWECFQVEDYRGGDATSKMTLDSGDNLKNGYSVFPMSQYYVQNIEVPMTLNAGATESGYFAVNVSGTIYTSPVPFIGVSGANAMFVIESGFVTKDYDEFRDRMNIDIYGTIEIGTMNISIGTTLGSIEMDAKDYVIPMVSNMTVNVNSGASVDQCVDVALIPGVELSIQSGATYTISDSASLYVYDQDQWGGYCGAGEAQLIVLNYAPSRKYTRTEADLVDAILLVNGTLDATNGYIYTTDGTDTNGNNIGGGNICSTENGIVIAAIGEKTSVWQVGEQYEYTYDVPLVGEVSEQRLTYVSIPITPAKLKNADGSFVQSATDTYYYRSGFWCTCETAHEYDDETGECSGCDYSHEALIIKDEKNNFTTVEAALEAIENKNADTVRFFKNYTVSGVFNLNGCDVEAGTDVTITLADDAKIIDTATDAYAATAAGSIELPAGTTPAGLYTNDTKHYVSILNENGAYEFHRVAASFNACRIARIQGVYYMTVQGNFRASDLTISKLNDLGLTMGFIFVDEAVHYNAEGEAVTFGSAIDYDGDENATKESLYVLKETFEDDSAYTGTDAAGTVLPGKYLPINYTFITSADGAHTVLCRVNLNGGTFDSDEHTVVVANAGL